MVGDVIEDMIVIPETAIRPNTDTAAKIQKSMGGQAANVASWLSYLGVETHFVSSVGFSDVDKLTSELDQYGVRSFLQTSFKSTGSLIVLVDGENRSMLTDRGANLDLNLSLIDPSGFQVVYLSGYSLLGRELSELEEFATKIKQAGALLVIDPGSFGFIKDHGVDHFRALMLLADITFPNHEEEGLLGLSGKVRLNVVTSGQSGARAVFDSSLVIESSAVSTQSLDPTGAGDAFCAGFIARLLAEAGFQELPPGAVQRALEAGVLAGSKAVGLIGARPA